MAEKYVIHLLLGVEAADVILGEVILLGSSAEALRLTTEYRDFIKAGFIEKAVYKLMPISGEEYLLDGYRIEGL